MLPSPVNILFNMPWTNTEHIRRIVPLNPHICLMQSQKRLKLQQKFFRRTSTVLALLTKHFPWLELIYIENGRCDSDTEEINQKNKTDF